MKKINQQLTIEQMDRKIQLLKPIESLSPPGRGWVHAIRTALKMSLRQLAQRMNITPQSVKEIEEREQAGAITLRALNEAAKALNMRLVYGFVPVDESLEKIIEKRAYQIAKEVVMRTSQTMKLEDQENSQPRIERAIKARTEEILKTMPRYLWD